jgi:hypothetical protein
MTSSYGERRFSLELSVFMIPFFLRKRPLNTELMSKPFNHMSTPLNMVQHPMLAEVLD